MDLDQRLQVLLQLSGKEVLQFTASEEFEDSLPVGRGLEVTQIWLHVSTQNTQGSGFSNTVSSDESEHLTGPGDWESVEFEAVGTISVSHVLGEVLGKIDNFDRVEGAPSDTHTTTNAKMFRYKADRRGRLHINANFARLVDRTSFETLLFTLLGLALIWVDDGNSKFLFGYWGSFCLHDSFKITTN